MRDSIGGAMLFWIVLFLFSVFVVFIALIIKYARVYKTKNHMINYIEKNEGVISQEAFDFQLLYKGYSDNGEYKICRYLSPKTGGYYYIELYSVTEFPLLGNYAAVKIAIKGETRMIETGTKIRGTEGTWFTGTTSECKLCNIKRKSCVAVDTDPEREM